MTIKWIGSTQPGRIGVVTPYNGEFVKELKRLVPSARWNGSAWFFNEISRADVEALVARFYEQPTQRYRLEFQLKREDNVLIDGSNLLWVNRDDWRWRQDSVISFRVIEARLSAGGSRRNPTISGHLVIEADLRADATVLPEPVSRELITDENQNEKAKGSEKGSEHDPSPSDE